MNRIIFLGTGGGNFVMVKQARKTGGIFLELNDKKIIIDPGPGCLVYARMLGLKPEKWDIMLLSHFHIDHSTDANPILGAMYDYGRVRRPVLIAQETCVNVNKEEYPCISKYHQRLSEVHAVRAGMVVEKYGIKVKAVRADHYNSCVGFRIETEKHRIGYAADGIYYKGQEKNFEDCDILILNVLVPEGRKNLNKKQKKHMTVMQAIKLVNAIRKKPKAIIIQHFSFWMIHAGIKRQIDLIQKETGIKTIAAEDFMQVDVDKMKTKKLEDSLCR